MIFRHRLRNAWIICTAITLSSHSTLAQTGPFTQAQVTAGHKNFTAYCASCHGDTLAGSGDAPPLGGPFFSADWSKYSVSKLYAFIANAMPQGLEGELKPEEYSSIIAYLLAANGAKPGSTSFTGESDVKIGDITDGKLVPSVVNAPVQ